jgi:hypothetical protein
MRRLTLFAFLFLLALPLHAQFNPWVNQGTVIGTGVVASPGQPTVIYEANPQLISANGDGKVFKMWYENVASPYGIYYAESNTGLPGDWTQDSGNPIIALIGGGVKVFKNSTTYYLYAGPGNFSGTAIFAYTCTDGTGTNFVLQNATAVVPGSAGAWDSYLVEQLGVNAVVGGTWYGYYTGTKSGVNGYLEGLATSTDGLTWSKDAGNPIASMSGGTLANGQPYLGSSNFTFTKVGATYYGWSQTEDTAFPEAVSAGYNLPSDIMRWSAPAANGPWTPLGTFTYYRTVASEGVGSGKGQVADPSIVFALGNAYLFYTAVSDGTNELTTGVINGAVATGVSATQLVSSYEGVQNVPIMAGPSLNLNILAHDNFTRANANPIAGNWTAFSSTSGYTTAQILSDVFTSSTVGTNSDSYWNALSWANNQWSQITVAADANTSYVGAFVRASTAGALTTYRPYWVGTLGSPGTWSLQRVVAGSYAGIATGTLTMSASDTLLSVAIGTNIMLYWDGLLMANVSDSNISSGAPGATTNPSTAFTDTSISAWSGGSFTNAPAIPQIGGNAFWFGLP